MSFAHTMAARTDNLDSKLDADFHLCAKDPLPGQAMGDRFGRLSRRTRDQGIRHVIT
jgi:hypothetical protein